MNDRSQADKGPLAPRRPLSGPGKDQTKVPAASGSAHQHTMDIPVVTDRPSAPSAPREAAAPTEHSAEPAAPHQAPSPRPHPAPSDESAPATQGSAAASTSARPSTKTRKARLRLVRIDPWSVMKVAFALSIALAIVTVVAVSILWAVLGAAGVWEAINSSVGSVLDESDSSFDITEFVGMSRVLGLTAIVSAANVVLLTAIATLAAFLYNLTAALLGGLEVTLAEDR